MGITAEQILSSRVEAELTSQLETAAELFAEAAKLRPHQVRALSLKARVELADPIACGILATATKRYPGRVAIDLGASLSTESGSANRRTIPAALEDLLRSLAHEIAPAVPQADDLASIVARGGLPEPRRLRPVEIFLASWSVSGLAPGYYHLRSDVPALERLAISSAASVSSTMNSAALPGSRPFRGCVLVVAVVTARLTWLLGVRGARSLWTEAGRATQAILQKAVERGLEADSRDLFLDDIVHRAFGLDGLDELAVSLIDLGLAPPDAVEVEP